MENKNVLKDDDYVFQGYSKKIKIKIFETSAVWLESIQYEGYVTRCLADGALATALYITSILFA